MMPNSNMGFYDDRKSNTSKEFDKTESHSSVNSKGRPSLPDSTDHMFDAMLQGSRLRDRPDDTGSDGHSESAVSNTWSHPNIQQECSELDETDELFKGTDDNFFKISKPESQTISTTGSICTIENGESSLDRGSLHSEVRNGQISEPTDHLIRVSDLRLSEDHSSKTENDSMVEPTPIPAIAGDHLIEASDTEGTGPGVNFTTKIALDVDQITSPKLGTFKTSAFKTQNEMDNGDMESDSVISD